MSRWRTTSALALSSYVVLAAIAQAASSPIVSTDAPSSVGDTGAQLEGTINPNGAATTYHFEYGLDTSYGTSTTTGTIKAGTKPVDVHMKISSLLPGTTYDYRVDAVSIAGIVYGGNRTFKTGGSPPPGISVGTAAGLSTTGVIVTAQINPSGTATNWYVEYGLTTAYGAQTPGGTVPAGAPMAVSEPLSGLAPGTVFHYRFVAEHAGVITLYGPDATFETYPSPAPSERIIASTTPHHAHRKPFTFTTNGRLTGPSYYSSAQVCVGIMVVRFYDGRKLLDSTTDYIQPNCTFFNQTSFKRLPGRGKKGRTVKLKVLISYSGDGWLAAAPNGKRETVTLK